jgi:hypothetical protein
VPNDKAHQFSEKNSRKANQAPIFDLIQTNQLQPGNTNFSFEKNE